MKKPIIGIVVDNGYFNDIRVTTQTRFLSGIGYQITIFCYKNEKSKELPPNIKIDYIPTNTFFKKKLKPLMNLLPVFEWWWTYSLKKKIIKHKINILHVHDLYMAKCSKKAIKGSDIKLVLDLHENYPEAILQYKWAQGIRKLLVLPNLWKTKEYKYLSFADIIIVLSSNFRDYLIANYSNLNKKDIFILPNVPFYEGNKDLRPGLLRRDKSEPLVICYFGIVSKRRGIKFILEYLIKRAQNKRTPDFKLLLIGPVDRTEAKSFDKLFSIARTFNVLEYIPWISIENLPEFLSQSDICISPLEKNGQHESGIANKIFQYMNNGLPIIASNCKPQEDLILNARCGWTYKWNSITDLHETFEDAYKNRHRLKEIGNLGAKFIENEYNMLLKGKVLNTIYQQLWP